MTYRFEALGPFGVTDWTFKVWDYHRFRSTSLNSLSDVVTPRFATQLGKSVDQANTQERRRKVYLLTELCTGGDLKLGDNDWVWMVW